MVNSLVVFILGKFEVTNSIKTVPKSTTYLKKNQKNPSNFHSIKENDLIILKTYMSKMS